MSELLSQLTGDAQQVANLLAWASSWGLQLSSVTVGTCRVEVRPPSQPAGAAPTVTDRRPGLYHQFGGEVFRDVAEGLGLEPMVPALEAQQR